MSVKNTVWERRALVYLGIALVIIGSILSVLEFMNIGKQKMEVSTVNSAIIRSVYLISVETVKAVFIGLVIWSGAVLISNGLRYRFPTTKSVSKESSVRK